MTGPVAVKGLREFQQACRASDAMLKTDFRRRLKDVGEPVRLRAEALAGSSIRNIGTRWSEMKTGITGRAIVYVAPKSRRRGGSPRPNLGPLLMTRSLLPALDQTSDDVVRRMDDFLAEIGRKEWE